MPLLCTFYWKLWTYAEENEIKISYSNLCTWESTFQGLKFNLKNIKVKIKNL